MSWSHDFAFDGNDLTENANYLTRIRICCKIFSECLCRLELLNVVKTWSKYSSIHGVSHAAHAPSKKLAIFWALASFCSLIGLICFLVIRLSSYQDAGVVTSISYDNYAQTGLELPEISICVTNGYDMTDVFYFYIVVVDLIEKRFYELKNQQIIRDVIKNYLLTRRNYFQILNRTHRWKTAEENIEWPFLRRIMEIEGFHSDMDNLRWYSEIETHINNNTLHGNAYVEKFLDNYLDQIINSECDEMTKTCKFQSSEIIEDFHRIPNSHLSWSLLGKNLTTILDQIPWKSSLPQSLPFMSIGFQGWLWWQQNYQTVAYSTHPDNNIKDINDSAYSVLLFAHFVKVWFDDMMRKALWMSEVGDIDNVNIRSPDSFLKFRKHSFRLKMGFESDSLPTWAVDDDFHINWLKTFFINGEVPVLLNPKNSILAMDFSGNQILDVSDYVIRADAPVAGSCLKLNRTLLQKADGTFNGLRLVILLGNLEQGGQYWPVNSYQKIIEQSVNFDRLGSSFSATGSYGPSVIFKSGQLTKIRLHPIEYHRNPKPKGSCDELASNNQNGISIKECHINCFIEHTYYKSPCKCWFAYAENYPNYNVSQECKAHHFFDKNCFDFIENFKKSDKSEICPECGVPCKEVNYENEISHSDNNIFQSYSKVRYLQDFDYLYEDSIVKNFTDDQVDDRFSSWRESIENKKELPYRKSAHSKTSNPYDVDYLTRISKVSNYFKKDFQIKKAVSILDIYYPKLQIQVIKETEEDLFISLFSDIGGQMGLWLGISVVSMIEICHFMGILCVGRVTAKSCNCFKKIFRVFVCFKKHQKKIKSKIGDDEVSVKSDKSIAGVHAIQQLQSIRRESKKIEERRKSVHIILEEGFEDYRFSKFSRKLSIV